MANVCFTSANVCNYTCTSPPPRLPPEPNFCTNTTTPTPTGNTTTPTVTTTNGTGLIAGCVCGAIILLVLLAILIWWLWKKGKCCFVPVGEGSEAALRDNEEKQVELLKIEKKGTVILAPIEAPPAWPEQDGILSTSPNPNTDKTPGELSKEEEALPSPTTGGKPDGATSKKKKKKKKGSRSNRVSPEPDQIPSPSTGGNDG
ncbi:uncharacterized protein LOC105441512 isoform X2 [Strongylocentrotus purpuratus]|uniref:Uncharacterized protein n=1 Tax=Strongylocentrotus purpuratus TaxID=7668 RepID=A0A7M7NMX9_STRPU|nr:uncharacterized protein LOC105441512 isoform X2 [Strongylocentrotus purpuratus]